MRMLKVLFAVAALAVAASAAVAQPKTDSGWLPEPGLITKQREAVNLQVGGTRMTVKKGEKLPQGAKCLVDADTIVHRVGEDGDKVLVKVFLRALVQTDEKFCPNTMPFALTRAEWLEAKQAFDKKYDFQAWWKMLRESVGK